MPPDIELTADLNAMDDDGLCWSTMADARDPSAIAPGVELIAGNASAWGRVRVVAVDPDGQVHIQLPGNRS